LANMELCSVDIGETTAVNTRTERALARQYVREWAAGPKDELVLLEMLGLHRGRRKRTVQRPGPAAEAS
jgi:hypothetical protein